MLFSPLLKLHENRKFCAITQFIFYMNITSRRESQSLEKLRNPGELSRILVNAGFKLPVLATFLLLGKYLTQVKGDVHFGS